jgi:radical SAM superfamily enzyme YgiQ (UPF0313 family)
MEGCQLKFHIIYPRWPKLKYQTDFNLPPLGIITAAACVPPEIEVTVTDENVQEIDVSPDCDLIGIGCMLTCQAPRAYELADKFRQEGKTVVLGGLHVALCPDEACLHADSIVVGEGEGLIEKMLDDFRKGRLKPSYIMEDFPDVSMIGKPRRDLYDKKKHYTYKGWEMVDLVQTSRGCRFNCYPCCVPYLGGRIHRTKPIDRVLSEIDAAGDRLFIVDNSLEQSLSWQRELFSAMKGMGKDWVAHPISPDPELLRLAKDAGCWYVYHAVYTISDKIKDRIRLYHDHGIGVEGTILLGMDDHTEDFLKRFIDFLLEIDLDLAEFTVLTPFPKTQVWDELESQKRIIDRDWSKYNAGNVVFRPRHMTPDRLQELYDYAWESFYREQPQNLKMSKLITNLLRAKRGRQRSAVQAAA